MRRIAKVFLLVLLCPLFCMARDIKPEDIGGIAMNNFSHECIECSAYYAIAAEAARRSNKSDLQADIEKWQNHMLELGFLTGRKNRTEEMAQKVLKARLNMSMETMMEKIDSNIENISVLMVEYSERCKQIIENPVLVMEEYADKAFLQSLDRLKSEGVISEEEYKSMVNSRQPPRYQ